MSGLTLLWWNVLLDEIELNLILPIIATYSGQKNRIIVNFDETAERAS